MLPVQKNRGVPFGYRIEQSFIFSAVRICLDSGVRLTRRYF